MMLSIVQEAQMGDDDEAYKQLKHSMHSLDVKLASARQMRGLH